MHELDPLDRWEEEQQATTNPTLRDYASLVRAEPWIGFVFALAAFVVAYAAHTAATLYSTAPVSAALAAAGSLLFAYVMLVLLDGAQCRLDAEHDCRDCQQFEEKYREGSDA